MYRVWQDYIEILFKFISLKRIEKLMLLAIKSFIKEKIHFFVT